jgi:hypothetical protein
MLQLNLVAIALAGAALAVSGCGGSSKTGSSSSVATTTTASASTTATTPAPNTTVTSTVTLASGKPLTHSVWIARGNAICAHATAQRGSTSIKGTQNYAGVLTQVALYDRTEAAELAKLVPPPSKAADWKRIVDGFQLWGDFTDKVVEYAAIGNLKSARPLIAQGEKAHEKVMAIAARDGLARCAQLT